MNTGPADTRSPHLDLADLIAEVTGQAVDDRAREHLARCGQCRTEASRWDLVARGVRDLAAAAPQVAPPASPAHDLTTGAVPRSLTRTRPRTLLAVGAAAALVLLAGAGYWASDTLTRHSSGAVLTDVTGCAGIQQANGTLDRVNGASLVIVTASGQPVTVHTTPSTRVSVTGALRGDITDGAPVMVLGPSSGETIAAAAVTIGPLPAGAGALRVTPPPGWVVARGTVADAGSAGFTVVTSAGARVAVATSGDTNVTVPQASLGQLQPGEPAVAFGHAGPDGTLSAIALSATVPLPPQPGPQVHASLHVHGCSPGALAMSLASGT